MPTVSAFNQKKRIAVLWILTTLFLAAAVFVQPLWRGSGVHEAIEVSGLMLVFFAILGRLWSILYIGPHKNRKLVDIGPYSMTRNPLYFSSLVGIVGVGLMFGSLILTAAMAVAFFAVFHYTALREADYLRSVFGSAYDAYAERTPLLLPNPLLYRGTAQIAFSPAALTTTFLDALFLLALFPIIEGLEYLQDGGYLPTLLTLV
jgi:protein-S-isoprenylcysteine O-methyltransferase Ste14